VFKCQFCGIKQKTVTVKNQLNSTREFLFVLVLLTGPITHFVNFFWI